MGTHSAQRSKVCSSMARHAVSRAVMAAAALRRRGPAWLTRRGQGRRVVLEAEGEALEWQADGDPQEPVARLELEVQPSALRLVAP